MRLIPFRTKIAALGLALAGVVAVPSPAFAAAEPYVPADCDVYASAVDSSTRTGGYQYANGVASGGTTRPPIGFVPVTQQHLGSMGEPDVFFRSVELSLAPGGTLYEVGYTAKLESGTWKYSVDKKVLSTAWSTIRIIAYGYPYFYGANASGLHRYRMVNGAPVDAGAVGASGWGSLTSIVFDRTITIGTTSTGAARKADVLIAIVGTTGELVEYTIPHDTPGSWVRKSLRPATWNVFNNLAVGRCYSHPNARILMGIKPNGDAYVYYDANRFDFNADDIRGGTVRVAGGWTAKSFSQ
ncbi:MAG TPA: hypothetical protein VM677_22060 [Actinokineospora sp.]|jgi:hypothetical protein|nr:hypothetical protein [Actinokineospora sp.]